MSIAAPREQVYYYECSNGQFRLTYFIPCEELKALCSKNTISPTVLDDFPDGVDLGCKKADFVDFEETYGYRPDIDPDEIRRAFLALFSSTRNWKKIHGSGFIPASDLEKHMNEVIKALESNKLDPKEFEKVPAKEDARNKRKLAELIKKTDQVIIRMKTEGIDKKRTIGQQSFTHISYGKGENVEKVFLRLHQKRARGVK